MHAYLRSSWRSLLDHQLLVFLLLNLLHALNADHAMQVQPETHLELGHLPICQAAQVSVLPSDDWELCQPRQCTLFIA